MRSHLPRLAVREISLFESGDHKLIIWTIEVFRPVPEFKTLVNYPKRDDEGYITVEKYALERDAKIGHSKWIRKLGLKSGVNYGY